MQYFSDKENGPAPRIKSEISHEVWLGITAHIQSLICSGEFAEKYPEFCPDGKGICGTKGGHFGAALQGEIPRIDYPFVTEINNGRTISVPYTPSYLDVFDLVQFCYKNVSKPRKHGNYHEYYNHHHYVSFDTESAKDDFLKKINLLFARNELAYELQPCGQIVRLVSPSLDFVIEQIPKTADPSLNDFIENANKKIRAPDVQVRYEALKELWYAFERIKTVFMPEKGEKRQSTEMLLANSSSDDEEFKKALTEELKVLTTIGNTFSIRHSETYQIKLSDSDHIEYLFHRLASLMLLLTKKL